MMYQVYSSLQGTVMKTKSRLRAYLCKFIIETVNKITFNDYDVINIWQK